MMQVPLLDLKAQYKTIKSEINEALLKVAESQYFIIGPEVKRLEEAIAGYLGVKHCIGVSSGTDALLIALMALDVGEGDEVLVPDYSFFATAGVVSRLNADPVFADIDRVTFNLDPKMIGKRITRKTRAVIPVHLYGQSAEMDGIMEIAKKNGLRVIEDCAQAIGARFKDGRAVGTIGDIGCFSFFPSKNLGCFGDGGCVVTNDAQLAEKLRILRVHGAKPKYYHKIIGGNFRLDEIQAAVLNVKLPHLNKWSEKRCENADLYTRLFIENGLAKEEGKLSFDPENRTLLPKPVYRSKELKNYHIYNQYVVRVERRNELQGFLKDKGIASEVYYPVPFHRQECFADLGYMDEDFGVSNFDAEHSLALPIYPELSEDQIRYVVENMASFLRL